MRASKLRRSKREQRYADFMKGKNETEQKEKPTKDTTHGYRRGYDQSPAKVR